jgi:GNAT superfamily N-acetyltransferase
MNLHCNIEAAGSTRTTAKPIPRVRLGVEADIPQLLELGRMLHEENGMMPLSEEAILEAAWCAVRKNHAMVGVLGPVGAIEGMIYLTMGKFWYTDKYHLEELYAYVRPECRRSDNAKALVEFAKTSALRLKVPLLIGVISNDRTQAKIRMYKRQLGEPAGAWFLFNGTTGNN